MKKSSRDRIKELMDIYGLSQAELCRKTGVQKSALSNYLSGVREPRQDQLSLLADPFGVNPAWLMGYDAPMMMSDLHKAAGSDGEINLSDEERNIILSLRKCSPEFRDSIKRVIAYRKSVPGEEVDDNDD